MSARKLLTAFMSAAAITGIAACHSPTAPPVMTTGAAPSGSTTAALTRQPCDLLTPDVAKKYVGEDAQRQLTYDADPPMLRPTSSDHSQCSPNAVNRTVASSRMSTAVIGRSAASAA